jgi:rare lipoprotein A (peptidoglycan hydrolase)
MKEIYNYNFFVSAGIMFLCMAMGYILGLDYAFSMKPAEINAPHKIMATTTTILETGVGSWYDYKINGIDWSKTHFTCASRTLKRYSTAHVTNLANGKSVDCFVNDYGPEKWTNRIIDLSSAAFAEISELKLGLIKVNIN